MRPTKWPMPWWLQVSEVVRAREVQLEVGNRKSYYCSLSQVWDEQAPLMDIVKSAFEKRAQEQGSEEMGEPPWATLPAQLFKPQQMPHSTTIIPLNPGLLPGNTFYLWELCEFSSWIRITEDISEGHSRLPDFLHKRDLRGDTGNALVSQSSPSLIPFLPAELLHTF